MAMAHLNRDSQARFEPTPDEIRQACAEIQRSWSKKERFRRSGGVETGTWSPPVISCSDLPELEYMTDRAA
jgi:hypothetical protein